MTWEESIELIDSLADAAQAAGEFDGWELTQEERDALSEIPVEILETVEQALATYATENDMRSELVLKGLARIVLSAPKLLKAGEIGYEVQSEG